MGIFDFAKKPFEIASNAVQNITGEKSAKNESARNRAFQERLSNTAYQRAAKDLEAAGLNRILAVGSPASTPGGSTANIPNTLESMISSANMASGLATQKAQRKLMVDQGLQARSTAKAANSRSDLDSANARIRTTIADAINTPDEFDKFLDKVKDKGMGTINSAIDADKWMREQAETVEKAIGDGLENFLESINILPPGGWDNYEK